MTESKKVFIDTAPFIYYLEQNPHYYDLMLRFFHKCYWTGVRLVTSSVTVEEYCVFPYCENKLDLIEKFYAFLQDMEMKIITIDQEIADKAAKIRSRYRGFRAMDALHLAAASVEECQLFLTNDKQLKQFQEMTCVILDESMLEKL